LEILVCLLSNPSQISEFGAHLPLQIFILPRLLPVCQNRGERFFLSVFDILETQIIPKFLVQAPVVMILHDESKNASHLSFGAPNPERGASGMAHREKNLVFCTKISENTKNAPNFLNFGLELLYEVSCWAKEALAKIWS